MSILKLPLGIDLHVHFREPGDSYKETTTTGYNAALSGGIGTVLDMPNTNPPIDNLERYSRKLDIIGSNPYIHQIAAITDRNVEMQSLKEFAQNVRLFKVFMANSTGQLAISHDNMIEAFERIADLKPYIFVHAEIPHMIQPRTVDINENEARPPIAEIEAIRKVVEFADQFKEIKFHVTHVTTLKGAEILVQEKGKVNWDVLPKHLAFNSSLVKNKGNFARMNPPLRSPRIQEGLFQLFSEEKIPILTSDHAPHTTEDKKDLVAGAPGVQELYPFLIDQIIQDSISLEHAITMIFKNPKIILERLGLSIRRGTIEVDTNQSWVLTKELIKSRCKWSLWEDKEFRGKIINFSSYPQ